jgi:hypothetical protein
MLHSQGSTPVGEARARAGLVGLGAGLAAVPAALLATPFWVVSALTRRLPELLPLQPRTIDLGQMIEYAPQVGSHTRPHLEVHGLADEAFRLTTDAEGWRGGISLERASVVVFGDSFAFGHGVDDEDMYTNHVPGHVVKALGSNAYSMVQPVQWMERLRERIAGKQVIWFVYLGNDLYDSLRPNYFRWRQPFVREREGDWEIVTDHVRPEPWPFYDDEHELDTLARICTDGHESRRALSAADHLVGRARQLCQAIGSPLTVVTVPRRAQIDPERLPDLRRRSPDTSAFDERLPDRRLAESCRAMDVPFVPLADHLSPRHYQIRDIHWNAAGHERVGQVLAELLA